MKKNRKRLTYSFCVLFLMAFCKINAQESITIDAKPSIQTPKSELLDQIDRYQLFELNNIELYRFAKAQRSQMFEVKFQLGDAYQLDFVLEQAKVHGDDFKFVSHNGEEIEAEKNITYQGFVKDNPNSKVRMTISKDYVFGLILDEKQFAFETLKDIKNSSGTSLLVVYQQEQIHQPQKSCGHDSDNQTILPKLPDFGQDKLKNKIPTQKNSFLPTTYCAKLGIVLDWQGLAKAGSVANFNTDIQTILNVVNGYYAVFNVQYELNPIYVITASPNPWTDAPGAQSTLVANFRGWASPNLTPTNYNCALLFTGTNMNGIGYAYFAHMCQSDTYRFGEVDYQYVQPITQRANLTTHELGHLWGAQHSSSSSTLIMSPSIWNGTLQWDAAASSVISTGVNTTFNSCLYNCNNLIVNWTAPTANQVFTNLNGVNFTATASVSTGNISKVDFYVNNTIVGTDNTSPYALAWTPPAYGNYVLKATATDNASNSVSQEINIVVQNGQSITVNSQVNSSSDDAEQFISSGAMNLTSSDLELADDGALQEVGLRFTNINVPKNATIINAYVQFTADETNSTTINLNIYGQNIGNAPTFTSTASNITSRSKTSNTVAWSPAAWTTIGEAGVNQRTPNIATIVQTIVNRADWNANNAMAILINGGVRRTASAYDGVSAEAAKLVITYTVNNVGVKISPKVFLNNVNTSSALMPNDLAGLASFPLTDPYSSSPFNSNFVHVNNPTVATINPTILSSTGNNAIVDWLFLELKTGISGSTSVAHTKAALLQRDGDVVGTDGISPVEFSNASAGNYYITIRHRNHLGFRTSATHALSSNTTSFDFTNSSVLLYGSFPTKSLAANVNCMISGDANFDASIDSFDTIIWETQNGLFDDYSNRSDYNLDGSTDAFDSILWEINNGQFEDLN